MTVRPPCGDADVPRFWQDLGLPGLVDIHVHFLPERMLQKVWAWFDRVVLPDGRRWPITYRDGEGARVALLRALGVRAFPALVYAHKPGMAEWLNAWAWEFAQRHADCVPSATFFPEPEADRYVAEAVERGVRVFKIHLQVGGFDPRAALLAPVWRRLASAGAAVVVHAGSGPVPGPYTGPGPIGEVLAAHPALRLVVAHAGSPEYEEFLRLALRHEHVRLDTTMVFTDFAERDAPYPRRLLPLLAEHRERVLLGSDYPNIPHPYAHQLAVLAELGLGDDWLRAVCWHNGAALLGLDGER